MRRGGRYIRVIRFILVCIGLFFVSLFTSRVIFAATTSTIAFQSKLVAADGTNIANGTYNFRFLLYNVSSGGSAVWSEDRSITVTSGVVSTALGEVAALPATLANYEDLYLQICFDANNVAADSSNANCGGTPHQYEEVFSTRKAITSVPFALWAKALIDPTTGTAFTHNSFFKQSGNTFGATAMLGTKDAYALQFLTSDTARMTITSAGNVGVGTANPYGKLHVSDGNSISGSLITTDYSVISAQNTAPGFSIVVADNTETSTNRGVFKGVRSRGTLSAPVVPIVNDKVMSFLGAIYDGSTTQGTALIDFLVDGTVSSGVAPQRISFYTSATTGIDRVERLTIKSSGNVGIGTDSPAAKLTVNAATYNVQIISATIGAQNAGIGIDSNATYYGISLFSQGSKVFTVESNAGLLVGANYQTSNAPTNGAIIEGNVGVGTASPGYNLDLGANTSALNVGAYGGGGSGTIRLLGESLFYFSGGGIGSILAMGSADSGMDFDLSLDAGGSGRLYIDGATGNVGVATTNPYFPFQVKLATNSIAHFGNGTSIGNGVYSGIGIGYSESGPTFAKSAIVQEQLGDNAARGKIHILNDGTYDNSNATLADARLTIDYNGKVGIGVTSPSAHFEINNNSNSAFTSIVRSGYGYTIESFQSDTSRGQFTTYGSHNGGVSNGLFLINSYGASDVAGDIQLQPGDPNATKALIVKSSGNVGIGTGSPGTKLHVAGNAFFGSAGSFENTNGWSSVIDNYGTTNSRIATRTNAITLDIMAHNTGWSDSIAGGIISTRTNHALTLGTNNSQRLVIQNTGLIGIGTSNPSYLLHLVSSNSRSILESNSSTAADSMNLELWKSRGSNSSKTALTDGDTLGNIAFRGYDGSSYVAAAGMHAVVNGTVTTGSLPTDLRFMTNSSSSSWSEKMRITASGTVGIGISVPTASLEVNSSGNGTENRGVKVTYYNNTTASGPLFVTNRYRGTTSSPSAVLSGDTLGAYVSQGYDGSAMNTQLTGIVNSAAADWSTSDRSSQISFYTISGTTQILGMRLSSAGYLGLGLTAPEYRIDLPNTSDVAGRGRANQWTTYSDARYKTNVVQIGDGLSKILQLRGVHYNQINDGSYNTGFIAQEVFAIMPELVSVDTKGYMALDYGKFTPYLVEAIKTQQTDLQSLKIMTEQLASATPTSIPEKTATFTLPVDAIAAKSSEMLSAGEIVAIQEISSSQDDAFGKFIAKVSKSIDIASSSQLGVVIGTADEAKPYNEDTNPYLIKRQGIAEVLVQQYGTEERLKVGVALFSDSENSGNATTNSLGILIGNSASTVDWNSIESNASGKKVTKIPVFLENITASVGVSETLWSTLTDTSIKTPYFAIASGFVGTTAEFNIAKTRTLAVNDRLFIDDEGNLLTDGQITAATMSLSTIKSLGESFVIDVAGVKSARISAEGATFNNLELSKKQAGRAVILAGEVEVVVKSSLVTTGSVIVVTPASVTGQVPQLYVVAGSGEFSIKSVAPVSNDVAVNWIMVNNPGEEL